MSVTRRNGEDVLEGSGARLIEEVVSRFVPPESARHPATLSTVEAADRVARHWTSVEVGPLTPGSAAHKRAICAMFRETFNPYRPSVIAWPTLGPDELRRLKSLPIWDIAVQTEGRARLSFTAFADPLGASWMGRPGSLAWPRRRASSSTSCVRKRQVPRSAKARTSRFCANWLSSSAPIPRILAASSSE